MEVAGSDRPPLAVASPVARVDDVHERQQWHPHAPAQSRPHIQSDSPSSHRQHQQTSGSPFSAASFSRGNSVTCSPLSSLGTSLSTDLDIDSDSQPAASSTTSTTKPILPIGQRELHWVNGNQAGAQTDVVAGAGATDPAMRNGASDEQHVKFGSCALDVAETLRSSVQQTSDSEDRALRRNTSPNGWVVQKFGGTSVGKFASKIAVDIVRESLQRNKVAVVCSARSTGRKVEGTTSRLLEIYGILDTIHLMKGADSVHHESLVTEYERLVQVICEDHIAAAKSNVEDIRILSQLVEDIRRECKEVTEYRVAAERWHLEIDSRSKDRLVSFGEKLSCRFVTALLRDKGVAAEYVDLADILHTKSSPKTINHEFYSMLSAAFHDKVVACKDRVPVITGYFGTVPGGLMDGEIGRGYTDLCAALCAVGLKADELQVWKEVDGIFTADPSKVPTARLLSTITPSEAAELTFYGSEVIHHLTMDQVVHASPPIRIRIKNVKNPRGAGTIVVPDPHAIHMQLSDGRLPSTTSLQLGKTPKRPTAVTIKDKISVINVHSNKRSISHGFFAKIFCILDRRQLSVDLISTSEVHVSMAIHSANLSGAELEMTTKDLEECGEVSVIHKMAILSLVGSEMKNMVGIAGRMFATLGQSNINIEMISQGASEINISCVIAAHEATRAMNVLHTSLFTFLD